MKKLTIFFKIFLIFSIFFLSNFKANSEEIFKNIIDSKKPISIEIYPNEYNKYIKAIYKAFVETSEKHNN